jgi:hypothetical protein
MRSRSGIEEIVIAGQTGLDASSFRAGAAFGALTIVIWSDDAIFRRARHRLIEVTAACLLLAALGLASALPSTPG